MEVEIISSSDCIDVEETTDEDIFLFNKIYLINQKKHCFVGKRINGTLLDLDNNDVKFLKQNNRGMLRVVDDDDNDDRYRNFVYREIESKIKDFDPTGYIAK